MIYIDKKICKYTCQRNHINCFVLLNTLMENEGLGVVPGERSFFHWNERNYQKWCHHSKKRTNKKNTFLDYWNDLKINERGTNGNWLKKRSDIISIRTTFQITHSKSNSDFLIPIFATQCHRPYFKLWLLSVQIF